MTIASPPEPPNGDPQAQLLGNASIARVYDYWLGGKYNLAVDRLVAEELLKVYPDAARLARENRGFLVRAVRYVAEQGIAQYIDIGSGLPTSPNVHEVARSVEPNARVVYVDRDPVVLSHTKAHLAGAADGASVFAGDMNEPEQILAEPELLRHIDFTRPVCVLLVSVLHFVPADKARAIVRALTHPLITGSYLIISVGTSSDRGLAKRFASTYGAADLHSHTPGAIASWFEGFELVAPGLIEAAAWQPSTARCRQPSGPATVLAGVGRRRRGPR